MTPNTECPSPIFTYFILIWHTVCFYPAFQPTSSTLHRAVVSSFPASLQPGLFWVVAACRRSDRHLICLTFPLWSQYISVCPVCSHGISALTCTNKAFTIKWTIFTHLPCQNMFEFYNEGNTRQIYISLSRLFGGHNGHSLIYSYVTILQLAIYAY